MKFQNFVNSVLDAIIITDTEGVITLINSEAEELFGYYQEELINHSIEKLIPKRFRNSYLSERLEYTKNPVLNPKRKDFSLEGLRKDGSEFPIDVNLRPLETEHGKMIMTIIRNVTSRKEIEAEREFLRNQLAQAQKMETIGHLTGGLAHDFNNILAVILGYTALLKELLSSTTGSEKVQTFIDHVLVAGKRAKDLIAQMMIFSRLENSEQDERESPSIKLQPIIKEVVSLMRSSIPSTININYKIQDDQLTAQIEPVKLHQILLNLVINARDAIDIYGNITIAVEKNVLDEFCNSCGAEIQSEHITICVHDTGNGISAELQSRMFEPLFTTKDPGKGTGMGLAMVHSVVHSVGGHIIVDSKEGLGTTICILLPVISENTTDGTEKLIHGKLTGETDLSGLHIMVVDDEKSIVFMLNELLTMSGAKVSVYNHPAKALAAFKHNASRFDLLVTDETMPEYLGTDLIKEMLTIREDLPVILCTGFSETVNAETANELGISRFLYKPIEAKQLLDVIENILGDKNNSCF